MSCVCNCIIVVYFPCVQTDLSFVWSSGKGVGGCPGVAGTQEYRPKQRVVQPRRTPRKSRQLESVDYSEFELESDTESESIFSEGDRTVVEEPIEVNG